MDVRKFFSGIVMGVPLLWLSGCGATLTGETTFADEYALSNALSPVGYHVALLDDGRYRVTVTGKPEAAPERLEKIALAHTAEYGAELHKKGFQAAAAQTSVSCGRTSHVERGQTVGQTPKDYRVVSIDVAYVDQLGSDPAIRPVKDTAEALKAELQSEAQDPAATAARAAAVAAECHR